MLNGLIDSNFDGALQTARELRNNFALSAKRKSLADSQHRNRVLEIGRAVRKIRHIRRLRNKVAQLEGMSPILLDFLVALSSLLTDIEVTTLLNNQIEGFVTVFSKKE